MDISVQDSNLVSNTGLGFIQRDKNVKTEEDRGTLEFKVIKNDGDINNLKLLTDLKNIISKQLPKMPKEYIVRLVFDKKHESMVIIQSKTFKIIGGVCYRPNYEQKFIEIAFLAISSLEQVKGFGTRLMNKLKDHCREKKIEYFLTYADNNAIGYFKKQGFSKHIKMPLEQWKDYIKDYDGGTLMEAYVNPEIVYSELSETIKKQKEFLIRQISKFTEASTRHKFEDLEKKIKKFKIESTNDPLISEDLFRAIPGVNEGGWEYKDYLNLSNNNTNINFYTQCKNIIDKLRTDKNSWPFLKPVDFKEVPDYYDIIKEPIDTGLYKTKESFVKDVKRIFSNAKTYNKPFTVYHKYAKGLEAFIEEDIQNLTENNL